MPRAISRDQSRALLQRVSRADFSNDGFPFATIREVDIGHATVLASRRTYMGELGWELYVPVEFAVTLLKVPLATGMAGFTSMAPMSVVPCCRL